MLIDLTGKTFNRWYVLRRSRSLTKDRKPKWTCRCICETVRDVAQRSLTHGLSKSCGCLRVDVSRKRLIGNTLGLRHGYGSPNPAKRAPEYKVWSGLNQRCTNPNNPRYKYYGGAGVMVCERWRSFENFLADMGPRPQGTSLGRFGDVGNYEPGNCEWMTPAEQGAAMREKGSHVGQIHSAATRRKISRAAMGRTPWNKGIPHTAATRRKISLVRLAQERDKAA